MLSPNEILTFTEQVGIKKSAMSTLKLLVLGFLAGMFIALAAVGANTASCMVENPGMAKLLSALIFPSGLAMVLIAGSELFTGNSLMIVARLSGKITTGQMLRNWGLVYISNFLGSIFVAAAMNVGGQLGLFNNQLAVTTIKTAVAKCNYDPLPAITLAIFCNILVCLAVWMSFAAKTPGGKLAALFLPVMLFVLSGFEHSIANMYYIPAGLLALGNDIYREAASGLDLTNLTWSSFFIKNLLPVTLGNIIGGCLFGSLCWLGHRSNSEK